MAKNLEPQSKHRVCPVCKGKKEVPGSKGPSRCIQCRGTGQAGQYIKK